jgi:hypothetical protein
MSFTIPVDFDNRVSLYSLIELSLKVKRALVPQQCPMLIWQKPILIANNAFRLKSCLEVKLFIPTPCNDGDSALILMKFRRNLRDSVTPKNVDVTSEGVDRPVGLWHGNHRPEKIIKLKINTYDYFFRVIKFPFSSPGQQRVRFLAHQFLLLPKLPQKMKLASKLT